MGGEVAGCSQPLTAGLAGPTQGSGTEVPPSTGKRVSTGHVETASAQLRSAPGPGCFPQPPPAASPESVW